MSRKAILIDPDFGDMGKLSTQRMQSFREWLYDIDINTVTITKMTSRDSNPKNELIIVSDPLEKIHTIIRKIKNINMQRFVYIIFNILISIFYIPDRNYLWIKKVLKNNSFLANFAKADFIISSNPPESSHILNYNISKKFNISSVVDVRDGWNDESLNFYRTMLPFRKFYEKKTEQKIYKNSQIIFTNSIGWKSLLAKRYSGIEEKIVTLPNRLDKKIIKNNYQKNLPKDKLTIAYAGKFTGSSYRRRPKLLFEPFLNINNKQPLTIELWGEFRKRDLIEIDEYKDKLLNNNIHLSTKGFVDKDTLYDNYKLVAGFILLSYSAAAIPSKVYEYIYVSRPILAFVLKGSAVHKLLSDIPNVIFYYLGEENNDAHILNTYFELCLNNNAYTNYPAELSEASLKEKFQSQIQKKIYDSNV